VLVSVSRSRVETGNSLFLVKNLPAIICYEEFSHVANCDVSGGFAGEGLPFVVEVAVDDEAIAPFLLRSKINRAGIRRQEANRSGGLHVLPPFEGLVPAEDVRSIMGPEVLPSSQAVHFLVPLSVVCQPVEILIIEGTDPRAYVLSPLLLILVHVPVTVAFQ